MKSILFVSALYMTSNAWDNIDEILYAETTCCKGHTSDTSCALEAGSNCVWLDPDDPIAEAAKSQCLGQAFVACQQSGVSTCIGRVARAGKPDPVCGAATPIDYSIVYRSGAATATPSTPSVVACQTGETLLSCGLQGTHIVGGTWVDPARNNECMAYTNSGAWSVTAQAVCATFPAGAVYSVTTAVTSTVQQSQTIQCPSSTGGSGILTGCMVKWETGAEGVNGVPAGGGLKGCYSGPDEQGNSPQTSSWIPTDQRCNGEAYPGATVNIAAQCIEFQNGYSLQCNTKAKFTNLANFGGSEVCEAGYELIACDTWTNSATLDSWYIQSSGACYVQQDSHISQYANGICCQLVNINGVVPPKQRREYSMMVRNMDWTQFDGDASLMNSHLEVVGIIGVFVLLFAAWYYYGARNKKEQESKPLISEGTYSTFSSQSA